MASQLAERVGRRIKEAREAKGWTKARLAREMAGLVDGRQVARWEEGKHMPRDDTLEDLARALGVSVVWFLAPDEQAEPPVEVDVIAELSRAIDRLEQLEGRVARVVRRVEKLGDVPTGAQVSALLQSTQALLQRLPETDRSTR